MRQVEVRLLSSHLPSEPRPFSAPTPPYIAKNLLPKCRLTANRL
jgi:hypothetical protein